jgi:hypothetical protein
MMMHILELNYKNKYLILLLFTFCMFSKSITIGIAAKTRSLSTAAVVQATLVID